MYCAIKELTRCLCLLLVSTPTEPTTITKDISLDHQLESTPFLIVHEKQRPICTSDSPPRLFPLPFSHSEVRRPDHNTRYTCIYIPKKTTSSTAEQKDSCFQSVLNRGTGRLAAGRSPTATELSTDRLSSQRHKNIGVKMKKMAVAELQEASIIRHS